jgi:hypothetical protein
VGPTVWERPAEIEAHRSTVTDAVALADPLVAVIVAVPFATEVTRPVDDTVTTAASDVAHVTVTPAALPYPTQTRNSGRAKQCCIGERHGRPGKGCPRVLGSPLSGKGTRPSYQIFSGNGVSLAAISIQERQTLAFKVKWYLMLSEKS